MNNADDGRCLYYKILIRFLEEEVRVGLLQLHDGNVRDRRRGATSRGTGESPILPNLTESDAHLIAILHSAKPAVSAARKVESLTRVITVINRVPGPLPANCPLRREEARLTHTITSDHHKPDYSCTYPCGLLCPGCNIIRFPDFNNANV